MGVTYKLKDEVVEFIISQKQADPSTSCRQLAESASEKFGLKLSKSSVHDVLKQSGITTPRGRKPKNKFEIPQEKKQQIQNSLSQVKLIPLQEDIVSAPMPIEADVKVLSAPSEPIAEDSASTAKDPVILSEGPDVGHTQVASKDLNKIDSLRDSSGPVAHQNDEKIEIEISEEYEGAGKIFYKAVQWDLGIFLESNIKERDWDYYLTYAKGLKVILENNQSLFIDLPLPIERCVRETADGLVNNIRPFVVHEISNQDLFKSCMDAQAGCKIDRILIVDQNDHILSEFEHIVEKKRIFMLINRIFVENNHRNFLERLKHIFFSQDVNLDLINKLLNVRGIDKISRDKNVVKLFIEEGYEHKKLLQQAAAKLNDMYLRDDQDRLVQVEI